MCLCSFPFFFMYFSTKLFYSNYEKRTNAFLEKWQKMSKFEEKNMYMKKIDHLFTPWYKDKNLINSINFHPTWACTNDWFTNFLTYWTIDISQDVLTKSRLVTEISATNVGACSVKGKVIYCSASLNESGEMKLEPI